MKYRRLLAALATIAMPLCASAGDALTGDSPDAPLRTNAQNYKDRMLATCIAMAYKDAPTAHQDASITASVFIEWTYYDVENSGKEIEGLLNRYLGRDYRNPLEGYAGARFDLLKCIDMYHSKELEAQVRKFVDKPTWIGGKPPAKPKRP